MKLTVPLVEFLPFVIELAFLSLVADFEFKIFLSEGGFFKFVLACFLCIPTWFGASWLLMNESSSFLSWSADLEAAEQHQSYRNKS